VKKIEAIVFPHELEDIRASFLNAGIMNMTVSEVREYGDDASHTEIYRSTAVSVDFHTRVKVEVTVPNDKVHTSISILKTKGSLGKGEEERILISSVNDVNQVQSSG
jgi:nitrogen regulatory protein P-II 1